MTAIECPSCWTRYEPKDLPEHATPCTGCNSVYHPSCLCPKKRATR